MRRLREAGYADVKGELFSQASLTRPAKTSCSCFGITKGVIAGNGLCDVNQNRSNFLNVLQKQSDKISAVVCNFILVNCQHGPR
jgi:hypothetical protein